MDDDFVGVAHSRFNRRHDFKVMAEDLSHYLVIAVSSRALFDLEMENAIFEKEGAEAYEKYQIEHEEEVLKPGPGFPLVQAILKLNSTIKERRKAEVVIISRAGPSVALRIMNSIKHQKLDITRVAFCKGTPVSRYLDAYSVTLFLSRHRQDVRTALNSKIAAGLLYASPPSYTEPLNEIRIAFDADAVVFSDESERVYKEKGLAAFLLHEETNARKSLPEGPFAKLLRALSFLQNSKDKGEIGIRTALITARNSPAHERVIRTLRSWRVEVDEMFFMGGVSKQKVVKAFNPHIFFDDQAVHCEPAAEVAPTAIVPTDYKPGEVARPKQEGKPLANLQPGI
jgi:5'-nucleotidase